MLILRPVIFGAAFFAVSAFINALVTHFLPELLEENLPEDEQEFLTGSKIDIMEGDSENPHLDFSIGRNAAVPEPVLAGAQPNDTTDEVGDISALATLANSARVIPQRTMGEAPFGAEGMDHNTKSDYNGMENSADFSNEKKTVSGAAEPWRASTGVIDDSEEMLPDLDSMAGAFVSSSAPEEPDTAEYPVSSPAAKKLSPRTKGSEWAGDFNAKDIAAGLRTVLKREKEG